MRKYLSTSIYYTSRNPQQCCGDDLIFAPSPILQPTPFQSVQRQYTKPYNASLLSDSTSDHHSPHHYTSPNDSPITPLTTPPHPTTSPSTPPPHQSPLFKYRLNQTKEFVKSHLSMSINLCRTFTFYHSKHNF